MAAEVKLEAAFAWTCPSYERRNFAEGVPVEWAEDDPQRQELPRGEFIFWPATVKCGGCGERFPVDQPEREDDGDEEGDDGEEWKRA